MLPFWIDAPLDSLPEMLLVMASMFVIFLNVLAGGRSGA